MTESVEPPPPAAPEVFGPRFALARSYVALLATVGVERGLLGPREPSRLWSRHVLNSVALAEFVPADADVVDLGSGAGLPGIPLVLARPDLRMTLVEPMARRAAFLRDVVSELGLDVAVAHRRAEDMDPAVADIVVARAVAPLVRLLPWALPLLRSGGALLALKGTSAAAEIANARQLLAACAGASAEILTGNVGPESATIVRVTVEGRRTAHNAGSAGRMRPKSRGSTR